MAASALCEMHAAKHKGECVKLCIMLLCLDVRFRVGTGADADLPSKNILLLNNLFVVYVNHVFYVSDAYVMCNWGCFVSDALSHYQS